MLYSFSERWPWSKRRLADQQLGNPTNPKAQAIVKACNEIIDESKLCDQFPVDLIHGGAGSSTNIKMNKVIADCGLELMGNKKGQYQFDVNMMSQWTKDVYPTAARLAIVFSDDP